MIDKDLVIKKAEELIIEYVDQCECDGITEFNNVMELFLSLTARGIEKISGNNASIKILQRTTQNLILKPSNQTIN